MSWLHEKSCELPAGEEGGGKGGGGREVRGGRWGEEGEGRKVGTVITGKHNNID